MSYFEEVLQNINSFCKVKIEKIPKNNDDAEYTQNPPQTNQNKNEPLAIDSPNRSLIPSSQIEEPLIDIFEEEDQVRILVQCRCREQELTFYDCADGIRICGQECHVNADGAEICTEKCQKIILRTEQLQLEKRLFIIATCKNNSVLEATIPKIKITPT
jgi:hypothetical protein